MNGYICKFFSFFLIISSSFFPNFACAPFNEFELHRSDGSIVISAGALLEKVPWITKKNIIFDLTGVLFYPSKIFLPFEIGFFKLARYSISHFKNPFKLFENALLNFLYEIEGKSENHYYKQYQLPEIICQLQRGEKTSAEVLNLVNTKIDELANKNYFASQQEKELIREIINFGLSPEKTVEKSFKKIHNGIAVLKAFAEKKDDLGNTIHDLYLLSNLDVEIFELLKQAHPDVFSCFKYIAVSGQTGVMKPDSEAFKKLAEIANLDLADCFFIDDQEENVRAALKLNMEAVQFVGHPSHF